MSVSKACYLKQDRDVYNGTRTTTVSHEEAKIKADQTWQNIPNAEYDLVCKQGLILPKEQLCHMIAFNRHANRICNLFGIACDNGTAENLIECNQCHLTWWCSKNCQKMDFPRHYKQWCMQLNNKEAVDKGPLRISLIQTN